MSKKKPASYNNPALNYITPTAPQEPEQPQEQGTQEVYLTKGTQGRKGKGLPRINMAFTHDNLRYLQIIARVEGTTMTEYVNRLLAADGQARAEEVERAKGILKGVE